MSDIKRSSVSKRYGRSKNSCMPKQKKKRNQSLKEFLYHLNKGRCTYCNDKFKVKELCVITKNHQWNTFLEPLNNKVITCKTCSSKKGTMNHREFIQYLYDERMKLRTEIVENYPAYAEKVFKRYEYKCIYCEFEYGYTPKKRKKQLTLDHKRSLLHHGDNDERNLAPACLPHNKEKGSCSPSQFFAYLQESGRKFDSKKTLVAAN